MGYLKILYYIFKYFGGSELAKNVLAGNKKEVITFIRESGAWIVVAVLAVLLYFRTETLEELKKDHSLLKDKNFALEEANKALRADVESANQSCANYLEEMGIIISGLQETEDEYERYRAEQLSGVTQGTTMTLSQSTCQATEVTNDEEPKTIPVSTDAVVDTPHDRVRLFALCKAGFGTDGLCGDTALPFGANPTATD